MKFFKSKTKPADIFNDDPVFNDLKSAEDLANRCKEVRIVQATKMLAEMPDKIMVEIYAAVDAGINEAFFSSKIPIPSEYVKELNSKGFKVERDTENCYFISWGLDK